MENLSDAELERRTRAGLIALGIEVPDRPLLLGMAQPSKDDDRADQADDGDRS